MSEPKPSDSAGASPRLTAATAPAYPLQDTERELAEALRAEQAAGDYSTRQAPCFCGETASRAVSRWVWLGLDAPTVLCERCGLLRREPRLQPEAHARLMERHGQALAGGFEAAREHKAMTNLVGKLKPLLDAATRAAHVGCGAGGGLAALREAGFEALGMEDRGSPLDGVHRSLAALASACTEPLDVLVVSGALDRSADLERDLAALRSLLRPGGVLHVEGRGLHTIGGSHEGDALRYLRVDESWHFTEGTLRWVLGCGGFEVVEANPNVAITARRSEETNASPPVANLATEAWQAVASAEKHILSQADARRTPVRKTRAPMHPAERSFFCVGMAKTGTTLLARVIDQHPDVAVTSESYPFTPDNLGSLFNPESGHYTVHGFSREEVVRWHQTWSESAASEVLDDLCQWTGIRYQEIYPFRKTMGEALASFASAAGASLAGDSWPYYLTKLPVVMQAFPRCKFIYNVRDPRAVWHSGQKWKGRGLGDKIMRDMLAADQLVERARLGDRLFTLRYEDLIHEPEKTMRALWGFLGADFKPEYLEYDPARDPFPKRWQVIANATAGFDPAMTRKWEQHVPPKVRRSIDRTAADFMKKYGYT